MDTCDTQQGNSTAINQRECRNKYIYQEIENSFFIQFQHSIAFHIFQRDPWISLTFLFSLFISFSIDHLLGADVIHDEFYFHLRSHIL